MKRRNLVVVVTALAGLVAIVTVRQLGAEPPTDEERIRALFDRAALAAEEKRIGDVVEEVSERFAGHGIDRQGLKRLVAGMVLRGDWVSVAVAGHSVAGEGRGRRSPISCPTRRLRTASRAGWSARGASGASCPRSGRGSRSARRSRAPRSPDPYIPAVIFHAPSRRTSRIRWRS